MNMLGVKVNTSARSGPAIPLRASSSQFFVAGIFERGPVNEAVTIRSKADLAYVFGSRTAYSTAYDQLVTFFDEGGIQTRIARVVGGAASTGSATLMDGAGLATLTVTAASPGAWSSKLAVKVVHGSGDDYRIEVYLNDTLVETHTGLGQPSEVAARFTKSNFVRVTSAGSVSAWPTSAPVNTDTPVVLTGGNDDRAAVVAANYISALDRFPYEMGDGAVAIPGQYTQEVATAVIDHCKANNRIAILAAPRGETKAELIARAGAITANAEYAGLFAPWISQSDGAFGVRTTSPEGYVAAARAKAHASVGPWRIPAGSQATATSIVSVDQSFTIEDIEDLNAVGISSIRKPSSAAGVRLYGWRSLSKDTAYRHLKTRDLLNYLTINAERVLEDFVFQNIDSSNHLASQVAAALVGLVEPISRAGGLYSSVDEDGIQTDPGYFIEVGDTVNTLETLGRDELHAVLYVRETANASLISINIIKVGIAESF